MLFKTTRTLHAVNEMLSSSSAVSLALHCSLASPRANELASANLAGSIMTFSKMYSKLPKYRQYMEHGIVWSSPQARAIWLAKAYVKVIIEPTPSLAHIGCALQLAVSDYAKHCGEWNSFLWCASILDSAPAVDRTKPDPVRSAIIETLMRSLPESALAA
jgi:hypothetical protein